MTTLPTQSAVTRAVKAAIKGAHELGYRVSSYEVVFNQGVPTVRVTTGAESPPPPVVQPGGGPILTNARGTAWTSNSMAHAVDQELTKLGIEGRLHGLRRNTATHLASQGRSSREIARVLGWSEADAEAMGVVYIDEGPQ